MTKIPAELNVIIRADIENREIVMIDVEKYVKDQIAIFQANEALEKWVLPGSLSLG